MREIKFRVKRKMLDLYDKYIETKWEIITLDEGIMDKGNCLMETIGQYTGLKDKNGVEIYENDEVNIIGDSGDILDKCIIEYRYDQFIAIPINKKRCSYELYINIDYVEVIGNIHTKEETK